MLSWYSVLKLGLVRPFVKVAYHPTVEGEHHIPATGGAVIACNHTSAVETYTMPALIKRHITYPAKAELFKPGKGIRGIPQSVVAWAMRAVEQVPLDRSGGRASLDGLGPVIEVVKNGGVGAIYPEGTRSPDGRLYRGKTGVARLALAANAPVVPCAVLNARTEKKLFKTIPIADHPIVRFGEPLDFSRYAGCENDREIIRWVTDEVMAAIQRLSGQEYVDVYATSVKYGGMTTAEADEKVKQRPGGEPAPEPCAEARQAG